jgi:nicotinamidase-related amidase
VQPQMFTTPEQTLDPAHTALLIIDMQKDFCTPGFGAEQAGRDLSMARSVIPTLAKLLAEARSAGVLVVHVGFSTLPDHGSDSGPWLAQRRRATASSENLCISGSEGAAYIDELAPIKGEILVQKHRYSAFTGTDLDLLLRARKISSIVVTGVSTNACVETTTRAGFELDYYVAVPPDGCGSWDRALHDATLANVRHRFGITPDTATIAGIWQRAVAPRLADAS